MRAIAIVTLFVLCCLAAAAPTSPDECGLKRVIVEELMRYIGNGLGRQNYTAGPWFNQLFNAALAVATNEPAKLVERLTAIQAAATVLADNCCDNVVSVMHDLLRNP